MFISRSIPRKADNLADIVLAGNGYYASTDINISSVDGLKGFCLFNPSNNANTFVVYRVLVNLSLSTIHPNLILQRASGDSNFSRFVAPKNLVLGAASNSNAHPTQTSVSATLAPDGTIILNSDVLSSNSTELLVVNQVLVIPPGQGIVLYISTKNLDVYSASFFWFEL